MGRTASPFIKNPVELLLARGRSYVFRKKYVQVVVFSTLKIELESLVEMFGGNVYPHKKGYVWMLSERNALELLVPFLGDKLPSVQGFEDLIIQHYLTE